MLVLPARQCIVATDQQGATRSTRGSCRHPTWCSTGAAMGKQNVSTCNVPEQRPHACCCSTSFSNDLCCSDSCGSCTLAVTIRSPFCPAVLLTGMPSPLTSSFEPGCTGPGPSGTFMLRPSSASTCNNSPWEQQQQQQKHEHVAAAATAVAQSTVQHLVLDAPLKCDATLSNATGG